MSAAPVQHPKSIDLARFAAALGIVWALARAQGQTIGYLALSLFGSSPLPEQALPGMAASGRCRFSCRLWYWGALWRMDMRLASPGRLAFGICLVHPLFMLVDRKSFGRSVNAGFTAVITFGLSMAATHVLRLTPGLRRMV